MPRSPLDKLKILRSVTSKAGREDTEHSTLWTTPWAWRDTDGCYVGHNGSVWLYRELPLNPVVWEDASTRLSIGSPLAGLLAEIGGTSRDLAGGIATFSDNREVHLVSVTWDAEARPPEGSPEALSEYLRSTLTFLVPRKALLVGVKLRSAAIASAVGAKRGNSLRSALRKLGESVLDEAVPDLGPYERDRQRLGDTFRRYGARVPDRDALRQLESWYNLGRGPDATIQEAKDSLYIEDFDQIEISAVMAFNEPVMAAPMAQWMLDASTHPSPATVISVRGELAPNTVARAQARRSERKVIHQMEEEAAAQDLERKEQSQTFSLARSFENWLVDSREPILADCSILMARRVSEADETYVDELRHTYGIEMNPLPHRQLAALDETLPCSSKRVNPFLQHVNIAMLAYAGLQAFSNLGDGTGVLVGLVDPDYTPCYLNPRAASAADQPPAMGVFGDPGSGKTWLCQMIATQAVLAGQTVIFVNPKGFDTLARFADKVRGTVVKMTAIEEQGGYFDPFRFAEPEMAAEIATSHILSVLGGGFTQSQELKLGAGLKRGAISGARCVAEALRSVDDADVRRMVMEQYESSSTFALGIGLQPQPPYSANSGLTLIEFDRKLALPEKGKAASEYTREERINLTAIRLVTRASLETLNRARGGVFILDEAWTFLSSSEGLSTVQQLGREGRSLGLLPIFATQRVADLIKDGVDMEGYMSRVFVLSLREEREARAALQLCGLEPSRARVDWLREAGPRRAEEDMPGRPALALHRDLKGRHAALVIGPVPPAAALAWTTNPEERRAIEEAEAHGPSADGTAA